QVDEFILDLRYNNGGSLGCAQLLCNILAPASALDGTMGYSEYNENYKPRERSITFDSQVLQTGSNLNLKRLYVLTTNMTASSSEIIINCLRPYMEVIVVGDKTEGKNVGSLAYSNEALQLIMRPIVCKIYNANHESDYSDGFKADVSVKESSNLARFLPFGDTNELLLGTTLGLIGGDNKEEASETRSSNRIQLVESSLQRRATGSVWID
ncbi:MAG: peptidase S41, partial [Bacteroides sp.]|nr:peptidase S41 [Bacteroides sp.]